MLRRTGETDIGILEAHKAALTPHLAETLPVLLRGGNLLHIPTNAGWTATVVGSGGTAQVIAYQSVYTGTTANSSGLLHVSLAGFNFSAAGMAVPQWAKKLYLILNYCRTNSDAQAVARVQLKSTNAIGALADRGIGLRVDNLALKGESYGTELGIVDLNTTLTTGRGRQVVIVHDPTVPKIEWYIDSGSGLTLVGMQTTSSRIPQTDNSGTVNYLVHSIVNGATGGTNCYSDLYQPKIWQVK